MSRPPKKHIFEVVEKAPTTLDYALQYIELGWFVLPVWGVNDDGSCRCGLPNDAPGHKIGKHPQANLAPRGHLDATNNPDVGSCQRNRAPDNHPYCQPTVFHGP